MKRVFFVEECLLLEFARFVQRHFIDAEEISALSQKIHPQNAIHVEVQKVRNLLNLVGNLKLEQYFSRSELENVHFPVAVCVDVDVNINVDGNELAAVWT